VTFAVCADQASHRTQTEHTKERLFSACFRSMEANESAINSTDWNTTAAEGGGEQTGSAVTWADVVMVTALSLVIAVTMVNKPALMFA
jgi:hypothetical protein